MPDNSVLAVDAYKIVKRIAMGGFGIVDQGVGPNGEVVALKKERSSKRVTRPSLAHEHKVYQALAGHPCIPAVRAFGRQGNFDVLVMDLLGPSLGDRYRKHGGKFSLSATATLGLGMLDAIEYIHYKGFIHRDLKPDNFLFGRTGDQVHTIHPVDFGLTRHYRDPHTGLHFPYSEGVQLMGTLNYASLGAHLGQAQSRRDDLQSFAYILLHFARGSLPWENLRGGTDRHRELRTQEKKRSWTAARLCAGFPAEMEVFTEHCLKLGWSEDPQYNLLRDQLSKLAGDQKKELLQVWNPETEDTLVRLYRDPSSGTSSSSSSSGRH
ncbi:kinase-like protein [Athelia psychrophila]|uniref:non-specific serine/threonine protein kinase n=1 Tax=Athelia psychrophila TaxID=1759441 RepID=A0A165ZSI0_9AGAM|nr:kinase-like protein [Fibularhizoctonia sp. CBS 109695]